MSYQVIIFENKNKESVKHDKKNNIPDITVLSDYYTTIAIIESIQLHFLTEKRTQMQLQEDSARFELFVSFNQLCMFCIHKELPGFITNNIIHRELVFESIWRGYFILLSKI